MTFNSLRQYSYDTPNPFKVGDRAVCVDNSAGYYGNLLTGSHHYVIETVYDEFVGVKVDDDDGGRLVEGYHGRFRPVKSEQPEVKTDPIDALLRKHADQLDEAIANGTMVPKLSSLGFLVNFLLEYKEVSE